MPNVTLIDYGSGNLLNVARAFEHLGAEVTIVEDGASLEQAGLLVLPGVGAFADGMQQLAERGFIEPVRRHAAAGKPFLGICLGMQMMLEGSSEFGSHAGLGLVAGLVDRIPETCADGRAHKIPHIGWNELRLPAGRACWDDSILRGLPQGEAMYFVHSYRALPADAADLLAECDYDGIPVCAAIQKGRLWGCQFHPEKSGESGLRILKNFLEC